MKNFRVALALSLVFVLFVPSVQAKENNSVSVLESSVVNNAESVSENSSEDNDDFQAQIVVSETIVQSVDKKESLKVWFVHGIKFLRTQFKKERRTLLKIYPEAEDADSNGVYMREWDAPRLTSKSKWIEARDIADGISQKLADEIISLPKEKQKRLVLAGHSLGGRIVVRTAAKLMKYNENKSDNKKVIIKKIILAGAAIDNDDKDIASTWEVSEEPVDNIINTQDVALAFYCWIGEKNAALGTGYKSKDFPEDRFHEIVVHKSLSHSKYFQIFYKEKHRACCSKVFKSEMVVPQVRPNLNWKTMNKHTWWNVEDECHGWELQKNIATDRYRIVDDKKARRAWGHLADDKDMREVFDIVKYRLVNNIKKKKSPMPEKWWLLINPEQDEFNINIKKNPQSKGWKDIETFEYKNDKGKIWRLQIATKSNRNEPSKVNGQKALEYESKRDAFRDAQKAYYDKKYEYKVFRKWWSRIRDKAPNEDMDEELDKKFDEELDKELEKELDEELEKEFDDEDMDDNQKKELKKELNDELNAALDEDLDAELDDEMDEKMKKEMKKELKNVYDKKKDELKNELKDLKKKYKETKKKFKEAKKYDETECRILDPENRRRAKGNETNMRKSFDDVKKQIDDLFKRYEK